MPRLYYIDAAQNQLPITEGVLRVEYKRLKGFDAPRDARAIDLVAELNKAIVNSGGAGEYVCVGR